MTNRDPRNQPEKPRVFSPLTNYINNLSNFFFKSAKFNVNFINILIVV